MDVGSLAHEQNTLAVWVESLKREKELNNYVINHYRNKNGHFLNPKDSWNLSLDDAGPGLFLGSLSCTAVAPLQKQKLSRFFWHNL